MVQSQIEDRADPSMLWPGATAEQLAPWLLDAELAIEWVATAGRRAAALGAEIPEAAHTELFSALTQLGRAIRLPEPGGLRDAASRARRLLDAASDDRTAGTAVRRLALAIINAATATADVRAIVDGAAGAAAEEPAEQEEEQPAGLRPTTRQAIQVSVAASLAIITGELVSPARWYWAVIAAFVIFAGTNSWGETLTKGWQRLLGTTLGVPAGVLVATLLTGHEADALAGIFVCLFCAFYLFHDSYLQPDDVLDHHHAGAAVRAARPVLVRGADASHRRDRARRGDRRDGGGRGAADQHPDRDPRRHPGLSDHCPR